MLTSRITVGLPVYKGADLIPKALDCLQRQTFGNFEAIISVDGNDAETAAACRPFLADPRFRMVVHPERLDWVGNFNWLLQQDLKEFFCYGSMTTPHRRIFSKYFCESQIRNRTLPQSIATVSLVADAMTLKSSLRSKVNNLWIEYSSIYHGYLI